MLHFTCPGPASLHVPAGFTPPANRFYEFILFVLFFMNHVYVPFSKFLH